MARKIAIPKPPPETDLAGILAGAFRGSSWGRAEERILPLRTVQTGLHGFNSATSIDGIPLGLVLNFFGPSQSGKTALALALCKAVIQAGGIAGYIDSEFRLRDAEHVASMLGFINSLPGGGYQPHPKEDWPESFRMMTADHQMDIDTAAKDAGEFCRLVRGLRKAHEWFPGGILVIDSLDTLVPKKFMDPSMKDKLAKSDDPTSAITHGRQGQIQAGRIADWIKHLIPQASESDVAVILICQERIKMVQAGPKIIEVPYPLGGKRPWYATSLGVRVSGVQKLYFPSSTSKKAVGTEHQLEFRKSSVGDISIAEGRFLKSRFFRSNGSVFPPGVDEWTDMIQAGLDSGILVQAGSSVKFEGETVGRGKHAAARKLFDDESLYNRIKAAFYADDMADARKDLIRGSLEGDAIPVGESPFAAKEFPGIE